VNCIGLKPYLQKLVLNQQAEHYHKLKGAVWLLLYLLLNCGNNAWIMVRKIVEIASQMGVSASIVQRWLNLLQKHNYILVRKNKKEQFIHLRGGIDLFYKSRNN